MNFSKSALFAALAAVSCPATSGFFIVSDALAGTSTSRGGGSIISLQQTTRPQEDIETMSYIENVARFCSQMGYTLDEYEVMIEELQHQNTFLQERSTSIDKVLAGLEWHENTPVDLHSPEALFKLKTALEIVLEVEVSESMVLIFDL
jgi:hypothetical protein